MPHLPSFFNNHKQNRSATALPAGNNLSSTSLPPPSSPSSHSLSQPPLQQHQQSFPQTQPQPQGQPQSQQYTAYSPPPESLSVHQQIALAQAQAAQQAAHHQLNPQSVPSSSSSTAPARHSSVSGPASGSSLPYSQDHPVPPPYVPAGLIRQSSGAAESQHFIHNPSNTENLQYSSNSSDAPPPPPAAAIPAKSTLRKPLLAKDQSSSSGGGISGLFHRHSSKHNQQDPSSSSNPPQEPSSSSIGRRLSTRKSTSSPQNSPKIPQQIEEDANYRGSPRSPRPQSLLPPPPNVEHTEALRSLRRSDTDTQAYQPRPNSQIQAPSPLTPNPNIPQYYNVKTGQYETHQQPSPQIQQAPPPQPQPQPQANSPPPPSQQKPQHQPPPQQQYPGHKSHPSQPHIQQPSPAGFARSSSDLANLKVNTNHPGGGLAAPSQQQQRDNNNNNNNNPPVSPGASVHTVDTMPGNQPTASGQQQPPLGNDGRATPTGKPEGNGGGSGMTPSQVQALMTEFDTLQGKYRKVKNLYFERAAEIERLQNTMANQRMSQSRTTLDDNQYSSRFERLDGAIKNLAFEIRQSWKVIPGWLQPVVNPGAEVKGGREMTVVGRAAMSRWVVDEILDRYFHPGLEPNISWNLKAIENGIRRNSPQPQSIEEDDNLSAKVCTWRMSTIDGVRPMIEGPIGKENIEKLKVSLEEKLMASLAMHLNEPMPPGLPGGVNTIIDLSVGLLENLPLESRDVRVWYPLPGEKFDAVFMRGETGLQPLVAPANSEDKNATLMVDGKPIAQVEKSGGAGAQQPPPPPSKDEVGLQPSNSVKSAESGKKQSVLKGIRGKLAGAAGGGSSAAAAAAAAAAASTQASVAPVPNPQGSQPNPSQTSLAEPANGKDAAAAAQTPGLEKVRVAGFMAVEVRGKSILIKAPVWT
ncbi:hypothetical protein TWF481_000167 [Arthrobotrys musiformis]|uniref:Uncharacterized protein n=1 Tax=Arthrobotrys musiformis TaxID=47236 RepID=A0AAV9WSJ2_9PEZI